MSTENTTLAPILNQTNTLANFTDKDGFALLQRIANLLSASDLVPKQFKGSVANTVIALEMAQRMGASPLAVMQNIYIVHGKPGWSSQFIIAAINSTKRYTPLRFAITGDGDKETCVAWAIENGTGERLESPPVSIAMAKAEGWYGRDGSKWKTMPQLMLRYRAATFFGRLYAPEVLMGMATVEEITDTIDIEPGKTIAEKTESKKEELKQKLRGRPPKQQPDPPPVPPADTEMPEFDSLAGDDRKIECPRSGDEVFESFCQSACPDRQGCPSWPEEDSK